MPFEQFEEQPMSNEQPNEQPIEQDPRFQGDRWEVGSDPKEADLVAQALTARLKSRGWDEDNEIGHFSLGIAEAVADGIVHGNKEDPAKKVTIEMRIGNEEGRDFVDVRVTDEGKEGFQVQEIQDPTTEENLMKTGGRGLFILRYAADDLEFFPNGVFARKYKKAEIDKAIDILK